MDAWPEDPHHDWPRYFRAGDIVRLHDGRVAVVGQVLNYADEPPPRWQLKVRAMGWWGGPDDFITEPWMCRPDPDAREEAELLGLLQ